MKFLYVHERISSIVDGVGFLTHNSHTCDALGKIGHEVVLADDVNDISTGVTNLNKGRKLYVRLRTMIPDNISIVPRDIFDIYRDRYIFRKKLQELTEKTKPDVLFERFTHLHTAGLDVAKANGIPLIMEIHSPWGEKSEYFSREGFPGFSKRVYQRALKESDATVVVSSAMKEYLCEMGGRENRIHVIPNAADEVMFNGVGADQVAALRSRYDLGGKCIIGFIGSMAPYHGVEDFIEAANHVCSKNSNIVFLLIGPFVNQGVHGSIFEKIQDFNISKNFIFTGKILSKDIPAHIGCMDVCVLPSSNNWYGSPIKLFEYGLGGKPVVAGKLKPIEDVVENNVDGLLFEPGNIKDMVEKLLELVKGREKANLLGQRLRNKIISNHTWIHNAKRLESIAAGLIEEKARARKAY